MNEHKRILIAVLVAVSVASVVAVGGCKKRGGGAGATTRPAGVNADYVGALATANEFCMAWQQGNYLGGKSVLSRRLISQHTNQVLRDVIAGTGNPSHAAFEISGGRRVSDASFEFKVRLLLHYSGSRDDRYEAQNVHMVVVRQGAGPWRIDEYPFPGSSVNLDPKGSAR